MRAYREPVVLAAGTLGVATAHAATGGACRCYENWVGRGRVNNVTSRGADAASPFRLRRKVHRFEKVESDGFMGAITNGRMTIS